MIEGDQDVDIILRDVTPELYGLGSPGSPQSIVGLRSGGAILLKPAGTQAAGEAYYDPDIRTVTFDGASMGTLNQSLGVRYWADSAGTNRTDGVLDLQLAGKPDYWGLATPNGGSVSGAGSGDPDAFKVTSNGMTQTSGWTLDLAPRILHLHGGTALPNAATSQGLSVRYWQDGSQDSRWLPSSLVLPGDVLSYEDRSSLALSMNGIALQEDLTGSGTGFRIVEEGGVRRIEILAPKADAATSLTSFRLSYVRAGENAFTLSANSPENSDCDTGFPSQVTGLLLKEDSVILKVNGQTIAPSTDGKSSGWGMRKTAGTNYNGTQLYSKYEFELVGSSRLSGGPHAIQIEYERFNVERYKIIFGGSLGLWIQQGEEVGDSHQLKLDSVTVSALGLGEVCLRSQKGAEAAIGLCDAALTRINRLRTRLGAAMNRQEHRAMTLKNRTAQEIGSQVESLGVDLAGEKMSQAKIQILRDTSLTFAMVDHHTLRSRIRVLLEGQVA